MASKPRKPSQQKTAETRLSRGRSRPEAIFPVAPPASALPETYAATLKEIKSHLRNARIRAILAANPIVIDAYWQTGKIILARQQEAAWGAKVIDRLAADLKEAFPDMSGLTARNLLSMKIFAREFPNGPIAKQLVSQLPWGQITPIIYLDDPLKRDFYAEMWRRRPRLPAKISSPCQRHVRRQRRVISRKSPWNTKHQTFNRALIGAHGASSQRGFIQRSPSQARGIQLTIAPDLIPPLAKIKS